MDEYIVVGGLVVRVHNRGPNETTPGPRDRWGEAFAGAAWMVGVGCEDVRRNQPDQLKIRVCSFLLCLRAFI